MQGMNNIAEVMRAGTRWARLNGGPGGSLEALEGVDDVQVHPVEPG
jgi:hypothetical protein